MVSAPGRNLQSRRAALQLPDLGRYVHGRRDARLLRLGRLCDRPEDLPQIVGDRLDAADRDPAHLEAELHRLGHELAATYRGAGLPALQPAADEHARLAVIGFAAAAPLWQLALHALTELDATFVATGTDDLAGWDAAVAAPIACWSADGRGTPEAAPLRELVREAIAAHQVALLTQVAWTAGDAEARPALAGLWDHALGLTTHGRSDAARHLARVIDRAPGTPDAMALVRAVTALSTLRDAIATRRRALGELGAAIDLAAGSAPTTEIALALAARVAIARALVGGVADWLADLAPVPTEHVTLARIRVEAPRVAAVGAGLERFFAATSAAVDHLIGMDL